MNGIFVYFLLATTCNSLVLDSANTNILITVTEYKQVLDLILEEKQLRHTLEHEVGTLQQQLNQNKAAHQVLNRNYQTLVQGHNNIKTTHDDLIRKYSDLRNTNQSIYAFLGNNRADISQLKQKSNAVSAFTVNGPTSASRSGYIKFTTVQSNIGGNYNVSSGVFTCEHPGVYMFILHLYRYPQTSYAAAYCYIHKNGSSKVVAYSQPYSSAYRSYYEATNSMTMHLNRGDEVSVGSCTAISSIYSYTTFTGFLVNVD